MAQVKYNSIQEVRKETRKELEYRYTLHSKTRLLYMGFFNDSCDARDTDQEGNLMMVAMLKKWPFNPEKNEYIVCIFEYNVHSNAIHIVISKYFDRCNYGETYRETAKKLYKAYVKKGWS